jgi:HEAT repeat protein
VLRDDDDAEVREQAESSLRTLAKRHRPKSTSREAVPLPVDEWDARLLEDKVLKAIAKELGVDGLLSSLQDGREFVRANAAAALGFSGKEGRVAAPMLLLALKDSAQQVRSAAAAAIGRLKLPIEDVALAMLSALPRSGPLVAEAVSDALGRYGAAGVQAVVDALADRQLDVEKSVELVARARHADFVGPLTSALAVDSPLVRRNAVDVLAALGPNARDAEPALVERLDDQDFGVRLAAVRALGRLGDIDDKVVFRLMDIVRDDPNVSLVIAAKEAFRYLGMGWRIPG